MGNYFKNNQNLFDEKKYTEIFTNAKPFDLVFFTSDHYTSLLIRAGEEIFLNKKDVKMAEYSHVAMIVSKEILNLPELEDNKMYIIESTTLSNKPEDCPDIYGNFKSGVQVRDLEKVCQFYSNYPNAKIALAKLKNNPYDEQDKKILSDKLTKYYNEIKDDKYADLYSLISSLISFLRFLRGPIQKIFKTQNDYFCSELVTLLYKQLGIFSDSVNEKNVVPMDLLGCDTDNINNGGINCVVNIPPIRFI